jgi:hypothetical protein
MVRGESTIGSTVSEISPATLRREGSTKAGDSHEHELFTFREDRIATFGLT